MRQYGIIHPAMLPELQPNFYPSICTFMLPLPAINSVGEEILAPMIIVELEDLPCRMAPKANKETRSPQQTFVEGVLDVTLNGFYPLIAHTMIPVIDGVAYQMEGEPEWDGNQKTTRFDVRVVN